MNDELLILTEKFNAMKARWWVNNWREKAAIDRICELTAERADINDALLSLEKSMEQLRASTKPKSWFVRAMGR